MTIDHTVENVIIIWSWPAWHTAWIYAWRALLKPLMFEGFFAWGVAAGGQLTTTTDVENFPWFPWGIQGPELMMNMREQSLESWVRIETKTVEKVDFTARPFKVWAEGEEQPRLAQTVIITTGATAKRLYITGEEQYRQKWVSACAVCDGWLPLFRNQHLIVIWGGDSAVEEANYLTKFASKVTMLVRKDHLRASKVMQQRAFENNSIEILYTTEAQEIVGDGAVMTGVRVINTTTQEESLIEAGWLFYAIGHTPNTKFLWWQIDCDETWYIKHYNTTGEFSTKTNIAWVFAAGDVADKHFRQAITSAGTGCMAALEAEHFLQGM